MPRAIVIGASRGIGRELVRAYAADGWQVAATVRDPGDAAGLDARVLIADVTDEASLDAAAASLEGQTDVLIVNAGVNVSEPNVDAVDSDAWARVMTVNALGPLLVARTFAGRISDGGSFVALSSGMGSIGSNSGGGSYSYRMSKAALNMALMNLALEWRPRGIAVAALHPGWVKTEMGGAGAPVEIADSVTGLRRVIAGLKPEGRARFLDYRGNRLDW